MAYTVTQTDEKRSGVAVLLLDDDQDWLDEAVELLRSQDVQKVDTARTKEDAEKRISSTEYDAVLADIELQPAHLYGKEIERGDEWLLSRAEALASTAIKAVVTADPKRIRDLQALEESGIRVAVKSLESEQEIFDDIIKLSKKKQGDVHLHYQLGEIMVQNAADLFLDWLNTRKDQASPTIWLGTRRMSISDITKEVATNTEIGQRFLFMFIEHLRVRLNMGVSTERSRE